MACQFVLSNYNYDMSTIYSMPGHLIRRLQQISASVFAERMKAMGLDLTSPQYAALSILHDNPGIDQATLAGLIAYDRPTIGGVVDRLVNKSLIERQTNPNDRRARHLTLTDLGRSTLSRLQPIVANIQDDILPGLTDQERQTFISLAGKAASAGNRLSRAPLILPDGQDERSG